MSIFLKLAFLFFIGSVAGWFLELFYRRFFSETNPERKWINPGLCTGPYVPLYGFGLCIVYLIASFEEKSIITNLFWNRILMFTFAALSATILEYIAGILCIKVLKVRLWDYSNLPGNIQGIICPMFSFFWAIISALYYFFIHPHILNALEWLSKNLAFSFVVGFFFGVLFIDVFQSTKIILKLKSFAEENDVIVRYEQIKAHIRSVQDSAKQKRRFFSPFRSKHPLSEHLKEMKPYFETRKKRHK